MAGLRSAPCRGERWPGRTYSDVELSFQGVTGRGGVRHHHLVSFVLIMATQTSRGIV